MANTMKVPAPRKLASGSWFIQLRLGGESIPITCATEKECIRQAQLIKAEYRNGIKSAPSGGNLPLKDAIDRYIAARENILSPSTIRGYTTIARTRFQSVMKKPLNQIKWQAVINQEAKIASPKTIKNAFGFISSVYRENDLVLPSVQLPQPEVKERAFLSPQEIPTFISACQGNRYEIGCLLALSGLRRSEIYGLTWEDIDLDANTIHIHQSAVMNEDQQVVIRSKNKNQSSTRTIPIMIPRLREALTAVENKRDTVVNAGISTLSKVVNRICIGSGLPPVGLHGLRHSFASLCYSLGIDEITCQRLGGWNDYQTMRRIYTHLAEADKVKNIDKLSEFFKNANENANEI